MLRHHSATSATVRVDAIKSLGQGDRNFSQADFLLQDFVAHRGLYFQESDQMGLTEVPTDQGCPTCMAEHTPILPSQGVHEPEKFLHLGSEVDPTGRFIGQDKVSAFCLETLWTEETSKIQFQSPGGGRKDRNNQGV
jgi:hypothetical protein